MILVAAVAGATVLARKLDETQVPTTPMHRRYAVVAGALGLWVLATAPAWIRDPTGSAHLLGGPGAAHLLMLGVIGFVIWGTLYHIVPFIIWVHGYSDRLGYEAVPMIDDLYSDRLARLDGALLLVGTVLMVGTELVGGAREGLAAGGVAVLVGALVFAGNLTLVLWRHSTHPIRRVLLGRPV